ncbi:MAG: DUF4956 domain-containing protein, partial [Thermoleophilia bacterium]|nr:DUF4956 domain-containing protein [Thermoleophilia bacterium]
RQAITLDTIHVDPHALRAELERRLGIDIVDVSVQEIDYVRETMRLTVRSAAPAGAAPVPAPVEEVPDAR